MSVGTRLESVIRIAQASVCLALLIVHPEFAAAKLTCTVGTGAPAPAIVEGTVMSDPAGAGIGGALVQWHLGKHQMLGSTDSGGRYAFEIPLNRAGMNPETVMLSAQANMYLIPAKQKVRLCPGNMYQANFQLKPEPANHIGTVHGKVIDPKTGKGIPNAIIAILIHRFPIANLSTDADDNGNYSIPGIGFGNGLTITVNTTAAPCVTPAARNFSVHKAMVTENFSLPTMTMGRLRCQGITGPEPGPETDSRVAPRADKPGRW